MKQEQFVSRYQPEWQALEAWLEQRAHLGLGVIHQVPFTQITGRRTQGRAMAQPEISPKDGWHDGIGPKDGWHYGRSWDKGMKDESVY